MNVAPFFRRRGRPTTADAALADLIERFEEPTAICESHGVICLSNGAWRALFGEMAGPLRSGHGLFVTFLRARREGRASGALTIGVADYRSASRPWAPIAMFSASRRPPARPRRRRGPAPSPPPIWPGSSTPRPSGRR